MGKVLAKLLFAIPAHTDTAKAVLGLGALAATLLLYGTTELIGGYGFLAVFIGALTIRDVERDHEYHRYLHIFAEKLEQLLMAAILLGWRSYCRRLVCAINLATSYNCFAHCIDRATGSRPGCFLRV